MKINLPERIIVVQIGKIGDMILTTPLLSGLKNLFPSSKLVVLSSAINKIIPLSLGYTDKVVVYKRNPFFFADSSLKNADIWIDTKDNYSKTSELLVKFFKPNLSIGFNLEKKIFDIDLNDFNNGEHAINLNLRPLIYFDSRNLSDSNFNLTTPCVKIPKDISNSPHLKINNKYPNNALINISAGSLDRYIDKDIWVDAINKINLFELTSFTLIGSEKDKDKINSITDLLDGINFEYIRTQNILEAAEIVRKSKVVISPDTSIIHLCSAFNIPVIGLYPDVDWNLKKFLPLSGQNKTLISKSGNSLEGINADEIVNAYIELKKEISGNAESRTRVRKEDH